jgi:hypothetical protein
MIRLAKLQFLGPLAVLVAVGAAEGAAFALAHIPTSTTLWYVNLRIFGTFQKSYYLLTPLLDFPYMQFFFVALPLFAIATYGIVARRAFPLALASHLSFIYTAFLGYAGVGSKVLAAASLNSVVASTGPDIYLLLVLIGASFMSFLVSHFQYLLGLIASISGRRPQFP